MQVIAVLLGAAVFGGVAVYALATGRVPIRSTAGVRRATQPIGYWLLVGLYAGLFVFSCWAVYLHLTE